MIKYPWYEMEKVPLFKVQILIKKKQAFVYAQMVKLGSIIEIYKYSTKTHSITTPVE